jgi:hypothetical protein
MGYTYEMRVTFMPVRRTHPLKLVLAAWLFVVTTAPAFAHEHAGGDKPHMHGLGLFATLPRTAAVDEAEGVGPNSRHFHMVIFGIEIHVPASCPLTQAENPCANQGFFQLGSEINALGTPADETACTPLSADVALDVNAAGFAALPDTPGSLQANDSEFFALSLLCHLARGLRSGAQQI